MLTHWPSPSRHAFFFQHYSRNRLLAALPLKSPKTLNSSPGNLAHTSKVWISGLNGPWSIFRIHHTCLWLQRAVWADSKSMDCCMCDCHCNAIHFRWLSHWVSDVRVMWYSKWHWYLPLGNVCVCVCVCVCARALSSLTKKKQTRNDQRSKSS